MRYRGKVNRRIQYITHWIIFTRIAYSRVQHFDLYCSFHEVSFGDIQEGLAGIQEFLQGLGHQGFHHLLDPLQLANWFSSSKCPQFHATVFSSSWNLQVFSEMLSVWRLETEWICSYRLQFIYSYSTNQKTCWFWPMGRHFQYFHFLGIRFY